MAGEMDKLEGDVEGGKPPADDAGGKDKPGDGKDGKPGAPKSAADKSKDRRNQVIIISLTAVGLIIGYLTLRKGGSSSATTSGTGSSALNPSLYPGSGTVAGSGGTATDPNANSGLQTLLEQMQAEIATLQSGTSAGDGSTVPTAPSSPYATTKWSGSGFDMADAGQLTYLQDDLAKKWYQVLPNGQIFQLNTQQINAVEAQYPNITIKHYDKAPVPGAPVATAKVPSAVNTKTASGQRTFT